jgi:hypothetical protein
MSEHWGLPDPSAVEGSESERCFAFADTRRMFYQRIGTNCRWHRSTGSPCNGGSPTSVALR